MSTSFQVSPHISPTLHAVPITAVKETMRVTIPTTAISSNQIEALGWVIVGVALMLLVIFRPQGILGNKKELAFNG